VSYIAICRALLVLGVAVGIPSVWETMSFSWDLTFQAPALLYGPTHSNYHAFREFTLTVGAILVMLWAMFQPAARRSRGLWVAMALDGVFDYGGWWLPWPILGLHTPNMVAELDHEAAAILSLLAIALSLRRFDEEGLRNARHSLASRARAS